MTIKSDPKNAGSTGNPALSIDEARQAILDLVSVTRDTDTVALIDAVDRVSAEDIQARHPIPLFRNSAMDGFAIRHDDFTPAATFNIVGKSLAGHPFEGKLSARDAIEITTGAMIPDDADTIVIVENTTVDGKQLTINQTPVRQQHVRKPGDDIVANATIVCRLQRLSPSDCGLLAAQGIDRIRVTRKPRVGILSTGDELRSHGEPLNNGQIYDSNRVTITSLLRRCGIEAEDLGIVQDEPASLQQLLDSRDDLDFILSSGGVSVGQADHVKAVVEKNGKLVFWKIAMKPGKPMVTARLNSGALYFGLPGNPVSSLVTCVQFVIPALRAFSGETYQAPLTVEAICTSALTKEKGRFEFQRGTLSSNNEQLTVTTTGLQDSHVLSSVSQANCFICLPQFSTGAAAGEKVQVIPFHALPGL